MVDQESRRWWIVLMELISIGALSFNAAMQAGCLGDEVLFILGLVASGAVLPLIIMSGYRVLRIKVSESRPGWPILVAENLILMGLGGLVAKQAGSLATAYNFWLGIGVIVIGLYVLEGTIRWYRLELARDIREYVTWERAKPPFKDLLFLNVLALFLYANDQGGWPTFVAVATLFFDVYAVAYWLAYWLTSVLERHPQAISNAILAIRRTISKLGAWVEAHPTIVWQGMALIMGGATIFGAVVLAREEGLHRMAVGLPVLVFLLWTYYPSALASVLGYQYPALPLSREYRSSPGASCLIAAVMLWLAALYVLPEVVILWLAVVTAAITIWRVVYLPRLRRQRRVLLYQSLEEGGGLCRRLQVIVETPFVAWDWFLDDKVRESPIFRRALKGLIVLGLVVAVWMVYYWIGGASSATEAAWRSASIAVAVIAAVVYMPIVAAIWTWWCRLTKYCPFQTPPVLLRY